MEGEGKEEVALAKGCLYGSEVIDKFGLAFN